MGVNLSLHILGAILQSFEDPTILEILVLILLR